MVEKFSNLITRGSSAVLGMVFALTIVSAGMYNVIQPATVQAASCDKVNIVYCGLNGSTLNSYISSFQKLYTKGSNNGHDDLKKVYKWAGATTSSVADMDTSNTKLGTLYRNGDVKVDGKVVATGAWVSARFGAGRNGFNHVHGDVYSRKTTTSFAESSAPVLVHFNAKGQMDFAVMTGCGNAVKGTPKPQPKPMIECVSLTAQPIANVKRKYTFTAKASAKDTSIVSYTFDFGDGTTKVVKTNQEMTAVAHQFAKDGTKYTVNVVINAKHGSDKCQVSVTTPKVDECKPGIPVGDERCTPPTPVTPTKPLPPTPTLPNTGMNAGMVVSLFGAIVAAAAFAHRFFMSRRLGY